MPHSSQCPAVLPAPRPRPQAAVAVPHVLCTQHKTPRGRPRWLSRTSCVHSTRPQEGWHERHRGSSLSSGTSVKGLWRQKYTPESDSGIHQCVAGKRMRGSLTTPEFRGGVTPSWDVPEKQGEGGGFVGFEGWVGCGAAAFPGSGALGPEGAGPGFTGRRRLCLEWTVTQGSKTSKASPVLLWWP